MLELDSQEILIEIKNVGVSSTFSFLGSNTDMMYLCV